MLVTILFAVLCASGARAAEPAGVELLANGSFEQWDTNLPVGWAVSIGATEGEGEGPESLIRPGEDAGKGKHCLSLSGDTRTQRWYVITQVIDVEPGEIFHFSGWIRSLDVRPDGHRFRNSRIAVQARAENGQRINMWILGPATGTTDWTRISAISMTSRSIFG
jgi:hypothetical protein